MPMIKGNREVVTELISDLRKFSSVLELQTQKMKNLTYQMNSVWKDSQYHRFKEYMDNLCRELKNKQVVVEQTANALQSDLDNW